MNHVIEISRGLLTCMIVAYGGIVVLLLILVIRKHYRDRYNQSPGEPPKCPRCGYLLIGLTERRCPECGRPF